MSRLSELYAASTSPADYVRGFCAHVATLIHRIDAGDVAKLVHLLESAIAEERTIFVMGNGGSAATASHFINDLTVKSAVRGQSVQARALTDNVASITAIANDLSYDDVFVVQLRAALRPKDVVIALSASGNSVNVIRAAEFARNKGALTAALVGHDGGKLKACCQTAIHLPTGPDEYGPIEDIFAVVMHAVTGYLLQRLHDAG